MCLPALELLAARAPLTLIGKPWAASLFLAYPWAVSPLAGSWWAQVRRIRGSASRGDVAILLTNSFGSALQLRLAGLAPRGYATDGRGLLLSRAMPIPPRWSGDMHTVEYYLHTAAAAVDLPTPEAPRALNLRLTASHREHARTLLRAAGVGSPYVVLCPVAVGRHRGQVKAWSHFGRLSAALRRRGVAVVAMPGPGETAAVRAATPDATLLPAADVGTFAALLAASQLVVANDSGPGHVAAAVGTPLISVFGVTDPTKTRPWGEHVALLGSSDGWPSYDEVETAVLSTLP